MVCRPKVDYGRQSQLESMQKADELLSVPLRSRQAHADSPEEDNPHSTSRWSVRDRHTPRSYSDNHHHHHQQLDLRASASDVHPSVRSHAAQMTPPAPLIGSYLHSPGENGAKQHLQDHFPDARSSGHGSKPASATAAVSRLHDQAVPAKQHGHLEESMSHSGHSHPSGSPASGSDYHASASAAVSRLSNIPAEQHDGPSEGFGSQSDPSRSPESPASGSDSYASATAAVSRLRDQDFPAEQQHGPSEGSRSHSDRSHSSESPAFGSDSNIGSQLAGLRRRSALRKSR